MHRLVHVLCQVKCLSKDTIIDAAIQGIRGGLQARKLMRKRPQSVHELFNKKKKYAMSEVDHHRRKSEMIVSKTSKTYPSNKETNAGQPKDKPKHSKKNDAFGFNSKQKRS